MFVGVWERVTWTGDIDLLVRFKVIRRSSLHITFHTFYKETRRFSVVSITTNLNLQCIRYKILNRPVPTFYIVLKLKELR
jgi:hypothetical protein